MSMPEPTPGHKKLEYFAGTWQGPETMHPSHWDPAGFVAIGRNIGRVALNGFALIFDYEQERDGVVAFTGHGVTTYDPDQDQYQMTWFDCMGTPPETFTGRFEGEVLTLLSQRGQMQSRMTYDFSDPEQWVGKMEMSADGESWNLMFDGVYIRV
jgi:hypothetical protein